MEWTKDKLWELRQQIRLNSLFIADYNNSLRVEPKVACNFFDGYMEFLGQECDEKGIDSSILDNVFAQDNPDNLWNWYGCFADESPLPTVPKKFWVSFEVNGVVEVEAENEDEAREKFTYPTGEAMLNAIDNSEPYITNIEEADE